MSTDCKRHLDPTASRAKLRELERGQPVSVSRSPIHERGWVTYSVCINVSDEESQSCPCAWEKGNLNGKYGKWRKRWTNFLWGLKFLAMALLVIFGLLVAFSALILIVSFVGGWWIRFIMYFVEALPEWLIPNL